MKCPHCGRELPYGSTYCLFCNRPVAEKKPSVSEPTRVMRPAGRDSDDGREPTRKRDAAPPGKRKPKKNGVNRKKILLYVSVASIAVAVVLIVVIAVRGARSFGKKPTQNRSFPEGTHSGSASAAVVPPPDYNTPSAIGSSKPSSSAASSGGSSSSAKSVSSAGASSKSVSSAAVSSKSVSSKAASSAPAQPVSSAPAKPAVQPADRYMFTPFSGLKNSFGSPGSAEPYNGVYLLSFSGCPYKFGFESEAPADSDPVICVFIGKGGTVVSGVTVGMTFAQVHDNLKPTPSYDYNAEDGEIVEECRSGNMTISVYFEKKDLSTEEITDADRRQPSTYALIRAVD